MGKIRMDMAHLVEEVRSSIGLRRSRLNEIHKGAGSLLGKDRRERGERGRALRERAHALAMEMGRQAAERRRAARSMHQSLRRTAEARRAAFGASRQASRSRLNGFHTERRRSTEELKARIGSQVAGTREAVGMLRAAVQSAMRGVAADVHGAERLWRQRAQK